MAALTLTRSLAVPRTPYAVSFSPDGALLAVGGGYLYGDGYVLLFDERGEPLGAVREGDLACPRGDDDLFDDHVIVTALCFDPLGRYLLCGAAGYKWHAHRPLLLSLPGLSRAPFADPPLDGPVTGVALDEGRALLRVATRSPSQTLVEVPLEGAVGDERASHLSAARLVVIDGVAIAHKNVQHVYSHSGAGPPMVDGSPLRLIDNPACFVSLPRGGPPSCRPSPIGVRCGALGRDRGGSLLAGLASGEIVEIEPASLGEIARFVPPRRSARSLVVRGVQGLCFAASGELVVADESGLVSVLREGELVASFEAPRWGSPRAVAAHPREPLVAVACKGASGGGEGAVHLLSLAR